MNLIALDKTIIKASVIYLDRISQPFWKIDLTLLFKKSKNAFGHFTFGLYEVDENFIRSIKTESTAD